MTPHLQGADARASRPRRSVFWLVSWEHLHRFYHAFLPWNIWHMGISRKFSRKPIQWLTLLNQWMVYPYVSSIFCKCFVSCACPKVAMIVPRFSSAEDSATWCIDKWKQHLQRNQVRVWKKMVHRWMVHDSCSLFSYKMMRWWRLKHGKWIFRKSTGFSTRTRGHYSSNVRVSIHTLW